MWCLGRRFRFKFPVPASTSFTDWRIGILVLELLLLILLILSIASFESVMKLRFEGFQKFFDFDLSNHLLDLISFTWIWNVLHVYPTFSNSFYFLLQIDFLFWNYIKLDCWKNLNPNLNDRHLKCSILNDFSNFKIFNNQKISR